MDNIVLCFNAFRAAILARSDGTERGASVVEYVLLVGLIAIVCLVAITALGGSIFDFLNSAGDSVLHA